MKLRDYKAKQNTNQQQMQQQPQQQPQQMQQQRMGQPQQQQQQQPGQSNQQFNQAPVNQNPMMGNQFRQQNPQMMQQQHQQRQQQPPQQYNQAGAAQQQQQAPPQQQQQQMGQMNQMNRGPMNPQMMQQQQQQQQQAVNPQMHPRFRGPHPQQQAQAGMAPMQQPNPNQVNPYFKSAPSPMTPNAPFTPSPLNNVSSPGSSQGPSGGMMNQPNQANQPNMQQMQHQQQQQQQRQQPISNDDQVLYLEKLKTLRKYIEPLSRIIYKKENEGRQNPTNINKIRNEIQKLRSLRDIILGKNQVTLAILEKCEPVLRHIVPPDTTTNFDDERSRDQHMCQGLLDVVSSRIRNPNMNHTLNRTFGPVLEKLRPEHTVTPRRVFQAGEVKSAPRPREIPSILQGEVAGLNKKFVARLDKSQSNTAGDVHIVVSISDLDLPPVKELKVTIPNGYPSIPPIIKNEQSEHEKDNMEMSEYDEDEDFLKIQESFFEERLDSLGPDLVTLTQILSAWELSIRQALAKMNINFANQRQMMVPSAV